jgi:3',5'-cyclic AMP phosphodiesterase CpdA
MHRLFSSFRSLITAWILLALPVSLAHAAPHDDDHDHPPTEKIYRPSPLPDRVNLTFIGDPRTSIAITWRTDPSVSAACIEIGPAPDGPQLEEVTRRLPAQTEPFECKAGKAHYHSVSLTDLQPGTVYAYRVGDGKNWSEYFQFRTAPAQDAPFSFVYFGDAQNDIRSQWSRVIRQSILDANSPAFFLHAGDLVNRHVDDHEWGEWFGAGAFLNAMIPLFPTPGNHEYSKGEDGKPQLSPHWQKQFTLPRNGIPSLPESVYYVDYGNTRFISLNSNEQHDEQALWLDSVLSGPRPLWTIITFHHPVYSVSKGRDNPSLREKWQPLFDKHKVDLVLSGHDHTYARSGPRIHDNLPTGAQVRRSIAGTVYVVSVSGPKMYELDRENWMLRAAEVTQLYQIIQIHGDRLEFAAKTVTGKLYDQFTLRKRAPGESAEFLDLQPATPEILRPGTPPPVYSAPAPIGAATQTQSARPTTPTTPIALPLNPAPLPATTVPTPAPAGP